MRVKILLPAPPTIVLIAATSGVSWTRAPSACVLKLILRRVAQHACQRGHEPSQDMERQVWVFALLNAEQMSHEVGSNAW